MAMPQRLVREHKISMQMIARACGVSDMTVAKVLDPKRCDGVSLRITRLVRGKITEALALFGHEFKPGELWKEYDQVEEAA